MTGRRKGTPCGCDSDPCGCSSKNHCMKTINNVSPDPNGDFWITPGVGIRVVETEYGIEITNLIDPDYLIAGANIELTPTDTHLEIALKDDISIGNLNVAGDIIQQGSSYETHAQQIFTVDDYIIMRDGAVGGLASGSYSGFQVKLYDGVNDGRLVIDNTGTARVGDVGDEQPLLTRVESNILVNGQILRWDSVNNRAYGMNVDNVPTDGSSNPVMSDGVYDALVTKGINNTSQDESFSGISVPAATITYLNTGITIPETGYYLIGATFQTSAMGSGYSLQGIDTSGTLKWMGEIPATGDGVYNSITDLYYIPAGTVVKAVMYSKSTSLTATGHAYAIRIA